MTVTNVPSRVIYPGDGTRAAFNVAYGAVPIPFSFNSDIKAAVQVIATGVVTPLAEGTDYTLTPIVSGVAGVLTLLAGNLATGVMLAIYRDEAIAQGTAFSGVSFPAASVERAIDTQCRISQQIYDTARRSLTISRFDSYPNSSLELPISRAGTILGFDASGNVQAYQSSSFPNGVAGAPCAISHLIYAGGAALSPGYAGEELAPFGMTITGWTLIADATGSCSVDLWKSVRSTFPPASAASSITGGSSPALAAKRAGSSSSITGWVTPVSAGDIISFYVNYVSGMSSINVILTGVRT